MRELVENAHLGEREPAVHVRIAEGADASRVEAVEIPDRLRVMIELAHDSSLGRTVDFVNYRLVILSEAKDLLSRVGYRTGRVGPSSLRSSG